MELLDRVATQDDKALKALYDRTSSKLYGLALRIVRERDMPKMCCRRRLSPSGAVQAVTAPR